MEENKVVLKFDLHRNLGVFKTSVVDQFHFCLGPGKVNLDPTLKKISVKDVILKTIFLFFINELIIHVY